MRFPFFRPRPPVASRLVVGLGNPGREYAGTRHNIGFAVIDALAETHAIRVWTRRHQAVYGFGGIGSEQICLAKPQTYMNRSGTAVASLARELGLQASEILVVCDDVNLPLGRLRLRARGSSGGSNGLKSVIASLGTEEFARLRVGVGRPSGGDLIDHVLGSFVRSEQPLSELAIAGAVASIECLCTEGFEAAMRHSSSLDLASPEE